MIRSISNKPHNIIPGFWFGFGYTAFYLSLLVLIPLGMLCYRSTQMGWGDFVGNITDERVMASMRLSFGAALAAAVVNAIFGSLIAWVITRYEFYGRSVINLLIDLPFALPTAVAGIALTALYAPNGMLGIWLAKWGFQVAYSPAGIIVALIFVGIPFVVRTVQPVIEELDPAIEEAALCLGANPLQTFYKVILPLLFPAILSGFTMAFARAVGEYGSVVFISGNMPFKTEIAPLLIMTKLEQYDYAGATVLGVEMLVFSLLVLFVMNTLQWWRRKAEA